MCRDAALLCVRDFVHTQTDRCDVTHTPTHCCCFLLLTAVSCRVRSPDDTIRPIHQSDLQRSISKMKKSKSAGGAGVLLHAALD